ncbi:MAG: hypothetical protein ACOC91_00110 [bacterium]
MTEILTLLAFFAATVGLSTLASCAAARTFALWRLAAAVSFVAVVVTLLALGALAWAVGTA